MECLTKKLYLIDYRFMRLIEYLTLLRRSRSIFYVGMSKKMLVFQFCGLRSIKMLMHETLLHKYELKTKNLRDWRHLISFILHLSMTLLF